jgi:transposase InsO family protein
VATIWRILTRRGFVTPQPQKRPRSSWKRFEADLPNQCWQADVTHWRLADHSDVEILDIIDDPSDWDRNRRRGFRPGVVLPRRRSLSS